MATNLKDGKTANKPEGTHGGNRGGVPALRTLGHACSGRSFELKRTVLP